MNILFQEHVLDAIRTERSAVFREKDADAFLFPPDWKHDWKCRGSCAR